MKKLLIVIKCEYLRRVKSRIFLVLTLVGPLLFAGIVAVPALLINLRTGQPQRAAIVDQTGTLYESVRDYSSQGSESLTDPRREPKNTGIQIEETPAEKEKYIFERVPVAGRSLEDIKAELNSRIRNGALDLYIVIPTDILEKGNAELYARNTADFSARLDLKDRIGEAVSQLRMTRAGISVERVRELSAPITLSTTKVSERGEERDTGGGLALAFGVGFLIYFTIILYGQMILGAVIEEKNTRISEILFSSASSFQLMMGKLIGVSLVALTQYAAWAVAIIVIFIYGAASAAAAGFTLPQVPASLAIYGALFFLVGYFLYATFYVLVGSMVTSQQEAGQLSIPVVLLLVIGFYMAFPVIKNPDSTFSFWVSMVPFFSPITMLVRISTQMPPVWQILLSLGLGFGFVIGLVWVASRIYRIGMLMYGKRASIPEAWRWLRQS